MAKVSRSQERTIADQQIYDNNAKEITPEMVKLALDAIIDSNYNLVDDELYNQIYQGSQTLEQKFEQQNNGGVLLSSISAEFSVLNQPGNTTVTGDGKMTMQVPSNGNHRSDLRVNCTFPSVGTDNYMPVVTWIASTGTNDWWVESLVNVTVGNLTDQSLSVFLYRLANNPLGKIRVTLFKID